MILTNPQLESFRTMSEALHARKPVLLTGRSNGKTTLVHEALEMLAKRDDVTGEYYTSPDPHSPNTTRIEYFPRLQFPENPRITMNYAMKQILEFSGQKPPYYLNKVVPQFEAFMSSVADQNRIICLAVDNAELLGQNAFYVLKALNEYRDVGRRRDIGLGILIAGDLQRVKKMPPEFVDRCTEVSIGKVQPQEIADFIQLVYPGQVRWFTDNALETLAALGTTLKIRKVLDKVITDRTRYRLVEIDTHMVTGKIQEMERVRIAA